MMKLARKRQEGRQYMDLIIVRFIVNILLALQPACGF
jgi:hypothetical protein